MADMDRRFPLETLQGGPCRVKQVNGVLHLLPYRLLDFGIGIPENRTSDLRDFSVKNFQLLTDCVSLPALVVQLLFKFPCLGPELIGNLELAVENSIFNSPIRTTGGPVFFSSRKG